MPWEVRPVFSTEAMGPGTGGGGGQRRQLPLQLLGQGATLPQFGRKIHSKISFLFNGGIFKIKWPKSDEKIEFGGRKFSGGGTLVPLPPT